jgi:hypothetical protein
MANVSPDPGNPDVHNVSPADATSVDTVAQGIKDEVRDMRKQLFPHDLDNFAHSFRVIRIDNGPDQGPTHPVPGNYTQLNTLYKKSAGYQATGRSTTTSGASNA